MAYFLNILYVIVVVVLFFGASIFIHEFGHYWMARRRGLKVLEFAIGFGPKMFGWNKDGIDYSIRWIPAGGYVKLPQMVTSDVLEGASQEKLPPISPASKILVSFAGPLMNVVFAFAIATLLYFIGLPVPINPPIVGFVEPKSAEYDMGIREGDRIISVNEKAVKSWEDVQVNTIVARTNAVNVVIERKGITNTYLLTPRISEALHLKVLNLDPREHPAVTLIGTDSPAAKAGLKLKDEFLSFGGVPVLSQEQLIGLIQKRPGQTTEIVVRRGNQKLSLQVTPILNPDTKQGRIGVGIAGNATIDYEIQHLLPWDLVAREWNRTFQTLGALFHSKQTGVGVKDLSGPGGILMMLGALVYADFRLALGFLVLLNINLAILNLFPIPVLDGGHIAMAALEKVRRKPISPKVLEYVSMVFVILLLSFFAYVSFNDLKRFSLFTSMFQHTTRIEQPAK